MRQASCALNKKEATLLCSKLLPEFEADGSLRDIYVLNTNSEDWNTLVSELAASEFNVEISAPFEVSDHFQAEAALKHVQTTAPVTLKVDVSQNVSAHSHFFTPEEVEFDFDPREVRTEADVASILGFMKAIGDILSKDVILTQEGAQNEDIATYKPATREFLTQ